MPRTEEADSDDESEEQDGSDHYVSSDEEVLDVVSNVSSRVSVATDGGFEKILELAEWIKGP